MHTYVCIYPFIGFKALILFENIFQFNTMNVSVGVCTCVCVCFVLYKVAAATITKKWKKKKRKQNSDSSNSQKTFKWQWQFNCNGTQRKGQHTMSTGEKRGEGNANACKVQQFYRETHTHTRIHTRLKRKCCLSCCLTLAAPTTQNGDWASDVNRSTNIDINFDQFRC